MSRITKFQDVFHLVASLRPFFHIKRSAQYALRIAFTGHKNSSVLIKQQRFFYQGISYEGFIKYGNVASQSHAKWRNTILQLSSVAI